jgi:hypothetical protein
MVSSVYFTVAGRVFSLLEIETFWQFLWQIGTDVGWYTYWVEGKRKPT